MTNGRNRNTKVKAIRHLSIWVSGYLLINFSGWFNTIGVFSYEDDTLLWPTLFGTIFNAVIFYGNSEYLLLEFFKNHGWKKYLAVAITGFATISLFESFADLLYYREYYNQNAPLNEIIFTNLLLNSIFFLLPSYLYRFAKDWRPGNTHSPEAKKEESITVKSGTTVHQIKLEQLLYVESRGNNVILHLDNNHTLTIRLALVNLMDKLPSSKFLRCHKSFVVALNKVEKMDYDFLYLQENIIPIGRKYREIIRNAFKED